MLLLFIGYSVISNSRLTANRKTSPNSPLSMLLCPVALLPDRLTSGAYFDTALCPCKWLCSSLFGTYWSARSFPTSPRLHYLTAAKPWCCQAQLLGSPILPGDKIDSSQEYINIRLTLLPAFVIFQQWSTHLLKLPIQDGVNV